MTDDAIRTAISSPSGIESFETLADADMSASVTSCALCGSVTGCGTCIREKIAAMMLRCSLATGHGDTVEDLLAELEPQIMALLESFEKLANADLKAHASKWLSHALSDRKLGIRSVEMFGSVVREHYKTSNVNVIVCLASMRNSRIAASVRRIRGSIANDFERTFGHKLRVQFFCVSEEEDYQAFKTKVGKHEIISLGERRGCNERVATD